MREPLDGPEESLDDAVVGMELRVARASSLVLTFLIGF